VIIWEGSPVDPSLKPPELYQLVENFCLGTRRLELFGRAASIRPGWVTALAAGQDAPDALHAARVELVEPKTAAKSSAMGNSNSNLNANAAVFVSGSMDEDFGEEALDFGDEMGDDGRRMEVEVDEEGRERLVMKNVESSALQGQDEDGADAGPLKVRRWEKEVCEKELVELANGGRMVVGMTQGGCCSRFVFELRS
jgi:hypothetical protein